jgi:hypothetical protein
MCWGEIGINSKEIAARMGRRERAIAEPSQCAQEAAAECLAAAAKGQIWTPQ